MSHRLATTVAFPMANQEAARAALARRRLCCKKKADLLKSGETSNRGLVMTEQHPFKWRHFPSDIILLCVRWYLRYSAPLSRYRRDAVGARAACGSHHDLPLGPALCS